VKTVIITMPMKKELYSFRYPVQGNSSIEYDGQVKFGVNGVLARLLEPEEKIKLLYIITRGGADQGLENKKLFRQEFDQVTKGKNINAVEEVIELNAAPTKGEFEKLTSSLIEAIDDNAEIIGDFSFGGKPFPFILMCVINFVEMFKNASLLYLIYSSLEWTAENQPCNPMIYDITSAYYLQKVIGAMEGQRPETAKKMLNDFFAL